MHSRKLILPVALVSLAFASQAVAQQGSGERNTRDQSRQRERQTQTQRDRQNRSASEQSMRSRNDRTRGQSQASNEQSRRGTAAGEVAKVQRVSVRNTGEEHLLVLLKTRGGKAAIVDLGAVSRLSKVDIATGDTLVASGDVIAVGNRKVLRANVVRKGNQSFETGNQQRQQAQSSARGNRNRGQGTAVSGTGQIVRTKKVNLRGAGMEHMVALIKMKSGNRRIVDLGPVKNLKNVSVKSGDTISVTGDVVAVSDKQVLMANQLQADGRTVQIDRRNGNGQQSRS